MKHLKLVRRLLQAFAPQSPDPVPGPFANLDTCQFLLPLPAKRPITQPPSRSHKPPLTINNATCILGHLFLLADFHCSSHFAISALRSLRPDGMPWAKRSSGRSSATYTSSLLGSWWCEEEVFDLDDDDELWWCWLLDFLEEEDGASLSLLRLY